MFPDNHNKLWSPDDIKFLDKKIKNNKCISESLIEKIANSLKRTKDSIKYKIIFTHIINEFDVNKDSSDILDKYEFIQSEDLVNKILTKKEALCDFLDKYNRDDYNLNYEFYLTDIVKYLNLKQKN